MRCIFQIIGLIILIFLSFFSGWAGSQFVNSNLQVWYAQLHRSCLTPPNWVFPIVWTILYFLLPIAVWIGLKHGTIWNRVQIVGWFLAVLLLQTTWTYVFFFQHRIDVAMVTLLASLAVLLRLHKSLREANRLSGILLIPQIIWIVFASWLNFVTWYQN